MELVKRSPGSPGSPGALVVAKDSPGSFGVLL